MKLRIKIFNEQNINIHSSVNYTKTQQTNMFEQFIKRRCPDFDVNNIIHGPYTGNIYSRDTNIIQEEHNIPDALKFYRAIELIDVYTNGQDQTFPSISQCWKDSSRIIIITHSSADEVSINDAKPISNIEMLSVAAKLCRAVDRLHTKGIVHGNICQSSVFINELTRGITLRGFSNESMINTQQDIGKWSRIRDEDIQALHRLIYDMMVELRCMDVKKQIALIMSRQLCEASDLFMAEIYKMDKTNILYIDENIKHTQERVLRTTQTVPCEIRRIPVYNPSTEHELEFIIDVAKSLENIIMQSGYIPMFYYKNEPAKGTGPSVEITNIFWRLMLKSNVLVPPSTASIDTNSFWPSDTSTEYHRIREALTRVDAKISIFNIIGYMLAYTYVMGFRIDPPLAGALKVITISAPNNILTSISNFAVTRNLIAANNMFIAHMSYGAKALATLLVTRNQTELAVVRSHIALAQSFSAPQLLRDVKTIFEFDNNTLTPQQIEYILHYIETADAIASGEFLMAVTGTQSVHPLLDTIHISAENNRGDVIHTCSKSVAFSYFSMQSAENVSQAMRDVGRQYTYQIV